MQTLRFNTGRRYTAQGQEITATSHAGRVTFYDHSRMIFGEIDPAEVAAFTSSNVLRAYDAGRYSWTAHAAADAATVNAYTEAAAFRRI